METTMTLSTLSGARPHVVTDKAKSRPWQALLVKILKGALVVSAVAAVMIAVIAIRIYFYVPGLRW